MMLSGLRWTFLCDVLRLGKCNEKVWSGDMSLNLALWDKAIQRKQGSTQVAGWTISWPWPQLNLAPSGQKSTHFAKLIALNMPTVPLKTNEWGSLINHPGQLTRRHMASVHWWPIIWPILKLMRCTVRLGMPLCTNLAVFFFKLFKTPLTPPPFEHLTDNFRRIITNSAVLFIGPESDHWEYLSLTP